MEIFLVSGEWLSESEGIQRIQTFMIGLATCIADFRGNSKVVSYFFD